MGLKVLLCPFTNQGLKLEQKVLHFKVMLHTLQKMYIFVSICLYKYLNTLTSIFIWDEHMKSCFMRNWTKSSLIKTRTSIFPLEVDFSEPIGRYLIYLILINFFKKKKTGLVSFFCIYLEFCFALENDKNTEEEHHFCAVWSESTGNKYYFHILVELFCSFFVKFK